MVSPSAFELMIVKQQDGEYTKWALLEQRVRIVQATECYKILLQSSIEAILIKGVAVARFYPAELPRAFSDIDVCVSSADYPTTSQLQEMGKLKSLPVDLHQELRDRDLLAWKDLFAHSQLIETEFGPIRVLADEDNLRVTAAHWLIDGGVYEDKLWDIYYLVKNRKAGFDWERCLGAAGPVRRTWVLTAIATAREYLDLDVSDLPDEIRCFRLPKWYGPTLEREWAKGPYARIPLSISYKRPKMLWEQARRRFPPNAIAATCDTESAFDESPRLPIQLRSLYKRLRAKF